jgi:hypothetical protein
MQHLDSVEILRFVHFMFSAEEALRFPMLSMKGWSVRVRCDRCQRDGILWLSKLIRRDEKRLLGDVLARVRCETCRAKPSAAMLTNARDPWQVRAFMNKETRKGPFQCVLWAERNT